VEKQLHDIMLNQQEYRVKRVDVDNLYLFWKEQIDQFLKEIVGKVPNFYYF
jgi:hypothetical protein